MPRSGDLRHEPDITIRMNLSNSTKPPTIGWKLFVTYNDQVIDFDIRKRLFHFVRLWNSRRYSFFHRRQKSLWMIFSFCQRLTTEIGVSVVRGSSGARTGPPVRKWPGVSANKSEGSSDCGEIGREFKHASIRAKRVQNSSTLNGPPIFQMWALKLFTPASKRPPMCGAPGGMICHCMFWWP